MGLFDTFKGKQFKNEAEALRAENERLKSMMTPEMQNAINLQDEIVKLREQRDGLAQTIQQQNAAITNLNNHIKALDIQIAEKNRQIFMLDEEIGMQDFGLYRPRYDFATSDEYAARMNIPGASTKVSTGHFTRAQRGRGITSLCSTDYD